MQLMAYRQFYVRPLLTQTVRAPLPAKLKAYETDFVPVAYDASTGKKLWRANCWAVGYNLLAASLLVTMPENASKWNKQDVRAVLPQYKKTFTGLPTIDKDIWYINYVGHPYQGSCYYNALRSQGATWWQSGLFSLGHSLLWEYVVEGGMEQPSVQDIIVTPVGGSLLGELFHFSTIRMSRNGFKWYEKVFVCVFNPMFALNNGFKTRK